MQSLKQEVTILQLLQHPNVIKLLEILGSNSKIFLVLEFIQGGELQLEIGA